MELDPILKRGLKLLHSRSKDSANQLKNLLEEAIRQRQEKSLTSAKEHFQLRRDSPVPRTRQGSPLSASMKNEVKRDLPTKFKDEDLHLAKRQKMDSPHNAFKSHTPSPTPSIKSESSSRSRKSEDSDSDTDMNDLANEIGITCSVCKSFELTSGNTLVECQECHTLYHQECHKPPVSHQEVTDPRLVWYCAKCSRSLKKQSSVGPAVNNNLSVNVRGNTNSGSKNGNSATSSRISSSPAKNHSGLQRQSPFANLSTASRSSNSSASLGTTTSSGGSNNGKNIPPLLNSRTTSNPILSAERRVNLMKKKAAAKNAERRKN